jgi:hypothetical protein
MIVIETARSVKEMYFEVSKIDLSTIRKACIFVGLMRGTRTIQL